MYKNMESYISKLIIFHIIFLSSACTSKITIDEKGRTVAHHFGYVQVIKPPLTNKNINVTGIKTIGVSIQNGITLGFEENKIVSVPMDCRVLVIVQNKQQLEHFIEHLEKLKGNEICATVTP
ncbi:hypothetical protein ESZ36_17105 [Colwellia demingiae]|uniref:Lipoprotein n=1 Tax=Colwellia demingiae TaxID=89401 RepID=A0A5C6Q902_9GAMM|nr:hypothetical protein [Colwellia demingiae]TWX65524.1 hypothetical protein ESZ36_17105 [Colwellia demingiae]